MDREIAFKIINSNRNKSILENICCAYICELYDFHDKAFNIYYDIIKKLNHENCNVVEGAALLFAAAEHARINRNKNIINDNKKFFQDIVSNIISEVEKENANPFGDNSDRVNTSTLGIMYGGLITINNFFKSDFISKKVKDIRNYVFSHNISKGTLVNGNKGREVSIDIILSVVPFGLFSPEDLVLVEAVKEIEDSLVSSNKAKRYLSSSKPDALSTLLLSYYYAEKGNYNRAKVLLNEGEKLEINSVSEAGIYLIALKKLELIGEIGDNTIIHKPYGNYNRYEPQIYERFPKEPIENEKVVIRALTWPISSNTKVYLNYKINDSEEVSKFGEFKNSGSESFYEWEIGPFNKYDKVEYYIYIEGCEESRSEIFEFNVLGKSVMHKALSIRNDGGAIIIESEDECGNQSPNIIIVPENDGKFHVNIGIKEKYENKNLCNLQFFDEEEIYKVINKNSSLVIKKDPFSIAIYDDNKLVMETARDGIEWYKDNLGKIYKIRWNCKTQENENYYGFGERYNDINQKGQSPDVYVYNQYKEQGIKTYIPVPFFISSKGYGIYIKSDSYIKYDMEDTKHGNYSFAIEDNELNFNVILGTPKEIISEYTNLTGKPAMLPKWAFGPWMSSNNWDSDSEVRKQVELTKKYEIPSTVFVIEAWSDEATYYIFNDAVYEENDGASGFKYSDFRFPRWGRWPDPKGMVQYLHENGLKCILWQIPIVKYMNGLHHIQKDADEEFMIKAGYCVKEENNNPYRMPEGWFKESLLMDFSNPEGRKWWFDKRRYLVEDIKVDGFKTDGGEFVFGNDIKFHDGKTGKDMRNLYPNDYVKSYYNFINDMNPHGGITFSRAGFTGAQKYPAHWAGDERSNFKAFRSSIIAGLNSGISGIAFWGWDLGGFSGDIPTAELFIRAAEMAAFCPIMQYHAESKAEYNQDRTPWNIAERTGDKRALDYYRFYANLRMNILPYIYNEALKCSISGIPLMKALFIEYPEDDRCQYIKDEYLFGDSMLVAPIVEEKSEERMVYLPQGDWIGLWDNIVYRGNKDYGIHCSLDKIPVFVKSGSIVPFNLSKSLCFGDKISNKVDEYDNLCFKIYGSKFDEYTFKDDLGNCITFKNVSEGKIVITSELSIDCYYIILSDNKMIEIEDDKFNECNICKNSMGETVIKLQQAAVVQ